MSKEGKEIKITDKRMFTVDGELRQEYRFLDEKSTAPAATSATVAATDAAGGTPAAGPPGRPAAAAAARGPQPATTLERLESGGGGGGAAGESGALLDFPDSPPGLGASFYDLAAMLAEPVAIYLGDLELPDGGSAENLEMARLHIDLLDVLRQKTAGNLNAQESAFLEDLLYRLRVRYVQKRG